jgi:hypothetical protein
MGFPFERLRADDPYRARLPRSGANPAASAQRGRTHPIIGCSEAFSQVIFYYGKCSIPKPFAITGLELDQHFGWPVQEAVEGVNSYFKERLFAILAGD